MPFRFSDDPERDRRRTLNIRRATQPVVDPSPPPQPLPAPVPPPPPATPEQQSQLDRTLNASQEAHEAGVVESAVGGYKKAAMDHFVFQRERHRRAEEQAQAGTEEYQREQMDALITGFSPKVENMPSELRQGAYMAAGVSGRPPSEVMEEWRRDEGTRRVRDFGASVAEIDDPVTRHQLGLMSVGLQKEGLTAEEYQKFIEGLKNGTLAVSGGQVYELQQDPSGQQAWSRQAEQDQTFQKARNVFDATYDSDLETIAQREPEGGLQGDPFLAEIAKSGLSMNDFARTFEADTLSLASPDTSRPDFATAIQNRDTIDTIFRRVTGYDIAARRHQFNILVDGGQMTPEEAEQAFMEDVANSPQLGADQLRARGFFENSFMGKVATVGAKLAGDPDISTGEALIAAGVAPFSQTIPGTAELAGAVTRAVGPDVLAPSVERTAGFVTSPAGAALSVAAPQAMLAGEVGAIAAGTTARAAGAPPGVEIAAEIAGGVAGAGASALPRFFSRGRVPQTVADLPEAAPRVGKPAVAEVPEAGVEQAFKVADEPITVGQANRNLLADAPTSIADKNAPNVILGRATRIDWKSRTVKFTDHTGNVKSRPLDKSTFFQGEVEAVRGAPVAGAVGEVVEEVPGAAPAPRITNVLTGAPDEELTLFRGLAREGDELIEGAHLTPNRADAEVFARTDAKLTGGTARVVPIKVPRSAIEAIDAADSPLAASQGAVRLRDPSRARVVAAEVGEEAAPAAGRAPSEALPTTDLAPLRAQVARSNNAVKKAQEALDAAPRGQKGKAGAALTAAKKTHTADLATLKKTIADNQTAIKNRAKMATDIGRAEGSAAQKRTAADVKATVRAEKTAKAGEAIRDVLKEDYPLVQKLRNQIRTAARVRPGVKAEIAAGRRVQAGKLEQAISQARERGLTGEDALRFQKKALKGELPRGEFDIPETAFSPAERERLVRGAEDVLRAEGLTFEAGRVREILLDKVFPGNLTKLQDNEISLLARVFDGDFALGLMERIGEAQPGRLNSLTDLLLDSVNFPRNVMAGLWDASGSLRQGGFMAVTQNSAWRKNVAKQMRAFVSEDNARAYAKEILEDPHTAYLQEGRLHMPLPGAKAIGGEIEEALLGRGERTFISRFLAGAPKAILKGVGVPEKQAETLGRILSIRGASDGMVTLLTGLRRDAALNLLLEAMPRQARRAYHATTDAAAKVGILRESIPIPDLEAITRFVNATTGRGSLGPLNPVSHLMALPFFSPRFVSGLVTRFGVVLDPNISRATRMLVGRELIKYYGTLSTILGLTGFAGMKVGEDILDVEWDARSTDFGKVKIGPTRIDITSGTLPLFRYVAGVGAGVVSGDILEGDIPKKTATGDITKVSLGAATANIIRSKLSPSAGLLWSMTEGEGFIGQEVPTFGEAIKDPRKLGSVTPEMLTPIVVQDIVEAVKEQGALGLPLGLLSFAGVGVVSYRSASVQTREFIHEAFITGVIDPKKYDAFAEENNRLPSSIGDLLPEDKRTLRQLHPDTFEELEKLTEKTVTQLSQGQVSALFRDVSERGREILLTNVSGAAGLFRQTGNGKQFRETTTDAILQQRGLREALQAEFEALDVEQKDRSGPVWDDLNAYFDIFDKYPNASFDPADRDEMLDEIERYFAGIGSAREAAVESNLGLDLKEVPEYAQMRLDKQTIRDAGWFDLGEEAWTMLQGATTQPLPDSKREYETDLFKQTNAEAPYLRDALRDQDPFLKAYGRFKDGLREQWIAQNRHLLLILDRWGYRELATSDVVPDVSGDVGGVQGVRPVAGIGR